MVTGSISLNNLTDDHMRRLYEAKEKHEGKLLFNDSTMRQGGTAAAPLTSGVVLGWNENEGAQAALELVYDILQLTPAVAEKAA